MSSVALFTVGRVEGFSNKIKEVNPDLRKRIGLIVRSCLEVPHKQTAEALDAMREKEGVLFRQGELLKKIEEKTKVLNADKFPRETDKQILQYEIRKMETEFSTLKEKLVELDKQLGRYRSKPSEIEVKLRKFDGDWIRENHPKLNSETTFNERINSFNADIKRPLIDFYINGKEVFKKDELKNLDEKEIKARVADKINEYHLNIDDFFTVLEFFHQGGTAQGAVVLNQKYVTDPMNTCIRGIGPKATVELQIQDGRLLKLVSKASYVFVDPLENTLLADGVKVCHTTYDFFKDEANVTILDAPLTAEERAFNKL